MLFARNTIQNQQDCPIISHFSPQINAYNSVDFPLTDSSFKNNFKRKVMKNDMYLKIALHCRQATIQATVWGVWNQADRQQSKYGVVPLVCSLD